MDWSKAKSILIVALLVTNLIMGLLYGQAVWEQKKDRAKQTELVLAYLEDRGIGLGEDLPKAPLRMPVLFVRLSQSQLEENPKLVYFNHVLVEGSEDAYRIIPIQTGQNRREIISAPKAILKYLSLLEEEGLVPPDIAGVELIYRVELAGAAALEQDISEDTALPAWKIRGGDGSVYYVNAYGE